ncbi:MAG: hypothetical protein ACOYK7_06570 [Pirellulales bacterium]
MTTIPPSARVHRPVGTVPVTLVGLVCVLPGLLATAAEPPSRPVAVSLEDQFRNRRDTAALVGDVVVLVFAERNGAEASHDLGRRLHVHFHPTAAKVEGPEWGRQPVVGLPGWPADRAPPDVHAVAVACLPEIPRAIHPVVRAQVRKESPHVPVWLDFTGVMPQRFGMENGVPNVLLIDTRGHAQGVVRGQVDDLRYRELVTAIDRLRLGALAAGPAVQAAGTTVQGPSSGVQPVSGTLPGATGTVVPAGGAIPAGQQTQAAGQQSPALRTGSAPGAGGSPR